MRYTYGAQSSLKALYGTSAIQDPQSTSGITSLADVRSEDGDQPAVASCSGRTVSPATCPPSLLQTGGRYDHFTGCAACHTPTQAAGPDQREYQNGHPGAPADHRHPVYPVRCLPQPRQLRPAHDDLPAAHRPAGQTGLQDYYQPIAQFTKCEWTLDCIDCHTRTEAMGDGSLYSSEADIQYIQCQTCHGTLTSLPKTRTLTDPNDLAFRLAQLNPVVTLQLGDTILVTDKGEPLWNTRVLPDGTYQLVGKATGQVFTFKPVMGSGCLQDPNDQSSASCHQCHSVQR